MIPYGRQQISAADIEAVTAVLKSDWLTQGPAVERFEQALAEQAGAEHAIATCNATAALHLACLALDLGPGDRLWTSPNTFLASANCGRYCGADVDFVDIDSRSYNMCVPALEDKLAAAARTGRLPKVVVPVAFAGQSCDMAGIAGLARRYGFKVIEDASHAVGARYRGQPVGCGRYADITVFSFHPVKIVTTGEGGAALTNDPRLAERLRRLRSHGMTRDAAQMRKPPEGSWYYEMTELGHNARITDIQAALGASQLQRLERFIARRRQLAKRYDEALAELPVMVPWQHPDTESALHLYPIQVDRGRGAAERKLVVQRLRDAGIGVNVHYIPVHRQPYYEALGFRAGQFPAAEAYYENALSLPMFAGLSDADQATVIECLTLALR